MRALHGRLARALAALLLTTALAGSADAANIVILNNNAAGVGFNDPTPRAPVGGNPGTTLGAQRLFIFQTAADIWSRILPSSQTIIVRAQFAAQTCTATSATLGSAGTVTIHANFANAPVANHWYNQAMANKYTGTDVNTSQPDINATFNLSIDSGCFGSPPQVWYYGIDGNEGGNIELLPVVLHELGHGLGFQTFTNGSTGAYNTGLPSIFDKFLLDKISGLHWDENSAAQRTASAIGIDKLVWDGANAVAKAATFLGPKPVVTVNSPAGIAGTYDIQTATFGAQPTLAGYTGNVVLVDDATGTTSDACEPIVNGAALAGNFALIDRGTCTFVVKCLAAQNAGAVGVLVANNVASGLPGMGGADPSITIPCVGITQALGNSIKANLAGGVNVTIKLDPTQKAGADVAGNIFMYSPNPFVSGSSVSHFDVSATPNVLMEPAINNDLHTELDMTPYVFQDIGWFPGGTTLSLQASPVASLCGDPVTLIAAISPPGEGKGTVNFYDGATLLGQADFVNNLTATLNLPGGFAVPGTHDLTAAWQCFTCSSPITSNTLNYAVSPRTITASAGPGGSITPSGAVLVDCGNSQNFTITPVDACHYIVDVVVDAVSQGAVSSYTFTNVQTEHTIAASFGVTVPAISDLAAAQQLTGNDTDGTTKIAVTYSLPAGTVSAEVWRKGFGDYPLYDNGSGSVPPPPGAYPPAGWTLTGITASGQTDEPPTRDYYYYAAFAFDACGDPAPTSNLTSALNYHLGDVTDGITAGAGDNSVATNDLSLLGAHYGASGPALTGFEYLDVGPTTDLAKTSRPTTDGVLDFDDLVLFAINYTPVVSLRAGGGAANAARVQLTSAAENAVKIGTPVAAAGGKFIDLPIRIAGTGNLQAVSIKAGWDPAVVEPVSFRAGEFFQAQGGMVLSPKAGAIDAALLGIGGRGIAGEGDLAVISFRVLRDGDPKFAIASLRGRDAKNQDVALAQGRETSTAMVPNRTELMPVVPNPARDLSVLSYSLAKAGAVELAVYSVDGRLVKTVTRGVQSAGNYKFTWNGTDERGAALGSGVYFVKLSTPGATQSRLITLIH